MELKFEPRSYCVEVFGGEYTIEACVRDEWELAFWSHDKFLIIANDEDGNARDWPSAAMAQLAAQQHYERMRTTSETPDVAASRIPTDPAWYEAKMGETP